MPKEMELTEKPINKPSQLPLRSKDVIMRQTRLLTQVKMHGRQLCKMIVHQDRILTLLLEDSLTQTHIVSSSNTQSLGQTLL